MDFSTVELSPEDQRFRAELRDFLTRHVTAEVIRRDRETGDNFDEGVHTALGAAGYLEKDFRSEAEGGWNALRRRIWELEIGRAHTPWFHWGTTAMVAQSVEKFGTPELRDEVIPGVLTGEIRLCLGYTEPEGGSDVATCRTRAVREADGSSWIINGAKMFTSNAHHAQYVFLLTNTDPAAPKHQSLTMFLVPLDTPGIEIGPIRTVDGDRTNIVYYSDVRVDDHYRIGEVNGGWTVLREALNVEHGTVERDSQGLQKLATMTEHALLTAEGLDWAVAVAASPGPDGRRLLDDESVQYRLGRSVARLEAALSTPAEYGRVAIAQMMRDITPELMDVLGAASALPVDTTGAAADGAVEYLFRLASPVAIYGGTVEVFRNMIAQHALGLGKPSYGTPVKR
ncbi:acyl-CoA dehydrogenase family protein [Mycolicibacterium thermoresistibile]|uniref:Acyl-CoA dehydrogenase domain-containing protein n=2 Tax=Mycolicibacterium thermoresistibile TaxID=1797 RepID=G7CKM4_MYCT3|nr:acyl-CoA dehydrogenase family protein [Mycolicibacterium thermoresistibile]EHI12931.1 acyl-CoA dehydrogenase domain-containing protein [Mycolicibacterium thermoresistibile ATCC 19527]MCV7188071.1 acyl-CoA dehydrogenase family protein [Mycolicibacterium thermoresistibile]GAT17272.1 acyl-CoA dehydrogenase [Mycolicibacterium thermoresistibile]SNW17836.1 acyl-CoA dehydrogenase domain-containing protein [Mycolicibacterium thermoresistibile]